MNGPRRLHQSLITEAERFEQSLPLLKSFAHHISHKYRREYDDLLQEGAIALLAAISRFDPSRQVSLRTYVIPRMRGAMLDSFKRDQFTHNSDSLDTTRSLVISNRPELQVIPAIGDPIQAKLVRVAITKLSEREQIILQLHFYEDQTFLQIGILLGVDASRVCQITAAAIKKIRIYLAVLPR